MKVLNMEIPQIGLGCWAIGGQFFDLGAPAGWGDVKDEVSLEALDAGISEGIKFIDTANIYGAGHSEELVGKAIKGRRNEVLITTKCGILCDEQTKTTTGIVQSPQDIIQSVEDSLRRLQTDYIDILMFHCGDYDKEKSHMVRDTMDQLAESGKIRSFGWSTSDPERAAIFAESRHCLSMEFAENVMEYDPVMMEFCKKNNLTAICRSPLAMGLLTGKYKKGITMPEQDLRGKNAPPWMTYYIDGKPNEILLKKLESIREILTFGGRTLAQGCIAYIWAKGEEFAVPIPGFKTAEQVRQNAAALNYGPLSAAQASEIEEILKAE